MVHSTHSNLQGFRLTHYLEKYCFPIDPVIKGWAQIILPIIVNNMLTNKLMKNCLIHCLHPSLFSNIDNIHI